MSDLLLHPGKPDPGRAGLVLEVEKQRAGWDLLAFSARRLAESQRWTATTGDDEACLVLQAGTCRVNWNGDAGHLLGPRRNVFSTYPYAVYLPPDTRFEVTALECCELAEGRALAKRVFQPRLIQPQDCGYEIRGGGNATRQIVDIMPPGFPADRLLACEVYTPSGNWSSYPPHKHDTDHPPEEVKLEETYYYRFSGPNAYGFQRVYTSDGTLDETIRVEDGDLVLIPRGYHPFVTAYGFDAYYLNFLAGDRRSMAASDDPRYAALKAEWPAADPRLPLVPYPQSGNGTPLPAGSERLK